MKRLELQKEFLDKFPRISLDGNLTSGRCPLDNWRCTLRPFPEA